MRTFNRPYDFYELPQRQRKHMIDQCFNTKEDHHKCLFFPVGLTENAGRMNYGVKQGLLIVIPIRPYKGVNWFKVGAFSPDDLDCDLYFEPAEPKLYNDVVKFIKTMNKRHTTYNALLETIQKQFGGKLDG